MARPDVVITRGAHRRNEDWHQHLAGVRDKTTGRVHDPSTVFHVEPDLLGRRILTEDGSPVMVATEAGMFEDVKLTHGEFEIEWGGEAPE